MGLDAQVKRWWWAVLASSVALTALFQAAGVGRMVAASLSKSTPVEPPKLLGGKPKELVEKSGQAILARNIFDSLTGPLDGSVVAPVASGATEPAPAATVSPLSDMSEDAPPCEAGRVVLISASEDAAWSFASIEDTSGKAQLRRMGQEINGQFVRAMAWNRVWLEQSGKQCQLKLGEKSKPASGPKPAGAGAPKEPAAAAPGNGGISPELAAKIHKVSDTEFNVERSVIDEILENQAELMKSARIVPDKQGDKVMGIRLFGIRSGTLLSTLGLRNGDRLDSINGFDMADPQKALEAYGRLRTADALHLKINRGAAPLNIDFKIQ